MHRDGGAGFLRDGIHESGTSSGHLQRCARLAHGGCGDGHQCGQKRRRRGQGRSSDAIAGLGGREFASALGLPGVSASTVQLDRIAGLYVSDPGGTLSATAGRDMTLTAAQVQSGGSVRLEARRDLTLDTLTTGDSLDARWSADNTRQSQVIRANGTHIGAAGDVSLSAGRDLTATAVDIQAGQTLSLSAGANLTIAAGDTQSDARTSHTHGGTNHASYSNESEQAGLVRSHNIGRRFLRDADRGTEGQTLHYSVPYGWWLLGFTASNSQYFQTIAGLNQSYIYAGKTNNAELKLTRMLWRDQHRKTSASLKAWRRESRNFVDDAEVGVQHRVTGGWELAVNHKEFIETQAGTATLEGTLAYKRGTGGFGARPAPEEAYDEGTSRMKLYTAELSANVPFKLGKQKLRYSGLIRAQWNRTPLTPQDRFAIGGRYTVRGFDGETSLMAERGWLIRNDIGWGIGQSGAELYTGLDYGHVGGPSTKYLLGNHLAGAVVGVRGAWKNLNYDVFVGAPVWKPEGYRTAKVTAGFNLNVSF